MHEIPSGTKVFDWTIPKEWNIYDAYIKDEKGQRIIDFKKSNLHVVNYSSPISGEFSLSELKKNIYTIPKQPDLIPYITSYYKERWGFCMSQKQLDALKEANYKVKIDSKLERGFLSYADMIIPGKSKKEILISTYICHPSMANNELSGPVLSTFLAKHLLKKKNLRYTYRFIFVPETIGAIAYLSKHYKYLKDNVIAGYVVTCVGDKNQFSYMQTRAGNTLVDKITNYVLQSTEKDYNLYHFLQRGSDERQYNYPGIDLPVGSLMRSKYHEYPEYHTSADNLDFISESALEGSLEKYILCLDTIEKNIVYKIQVMCEPHLSKYGFYSTLGYQGNNENTLLQNFLAYCDGESDIIDIAEKINSNFWELLPVIKKLKKSKLIKEKENRS